MWSKSKCMCKLQWNKKKIKDKTGVEYCCWLRSVRQEIMINVSLKTKMDQCQNCIRVALHHPFPIILSTTFILLYTLFSAYTQTKLPRILIEMSTYTHTHTPSPPRSPSLLKLWKRALSVWFPASHAHRITKVWPGCVLEKETVDLLPLTADVPS